MASSREQGVIDESNEINSLNEIITAPVQSQVTGTTPTVPSPGTSTSSSSTITFDEAMVQTLNQFRESIREHELNKYPKPPYSLETPTVSINGVPHQVLRVKYDGRPLAPEKLKQMEAESIKVRKLNLMAGVLFAMQFSPNYLNMTNDQKKLILDNFHFLRDSIQTSPPDTSRSPSDQIEGFVNHITDIISGVTKKSNEEVIRAVRNAEQYFVADNNRQRVLAFEVRMGVHSYWQIDIPSGNKLTMDQKQELLRIHDEDENNQPSWFKALPEWEKDWIKKAIPVPPNTDWEYFESLFQSSAMQHLPGIKNSRTNYFVKWDGGSTLLSRHLNASTMVPYEMPDDSRNQNTQLTAKQMLNRLEKQALNNFVELHDLFGNLPEGYRPIILAQSLLSDVRIGGADNLLTELQRQSIESVQSGDGLFQVISGNDPVNFLRMTTRQNERRWEYANQVLASAQLFIQHYIGNESQLSPKAFARLNLIHQAYHNLIELTNVGYMERNSSNLTGVNFEAFKVAYLGLLVEAMGGAVSTNCKSGKDRTGLEELYRNAMLIYFDRYKELPKFNDTPDKRTLFIEIYSTLFNSMKTQEAAACNTPGSFGLKDSAKMLCQDTVSLLDTSYSASNSRSDMNKPPVFSNDESNQSKIRNAILEVKKSSPSSSPNRWISKSPNRSPRRSSSPDSSSGHRDSMGASSSVASGSLFHSDSPPRHIQDHSSLHPSNLTMKEQRGLSILKEMRSMETVNQQSSEIMAEYRRLQSENKDIIQILSSQSIVRLISKSVNDSIRLNAYPGMSREEHDALFVDSTNRILKHVTNKSIDYFSATELKDHPFYGNLINIANSNSLLNKALSERSPVVNQQQLKEKYDELVFDEGSHDPARFSKALLDRDFVKNLQKNIQNLTNLNTVSGMTKEEHDKVFVMAARDVLKNVTGKDLSEIREELKLGGSPEKSTFYDVLFNIAESIQSRSHQEQQSWVRVKVESSMPRARRELLSGRELNVSEKRDDSDSEHRKPS